MIFLVGLALEHMCYTFALVPLRISDNVLYERVKYIFVGGGSMEYSARSEIIEVRSRSPCIIGQHY